MRRLIGLMFVVLLLTSFSATQHAWSEVGDPQIMTDHPWYPGELAMSTFERLQATQAKVYERVVGRPVVSDEDKALASWLWRNTHYAHAEDGFGDYFDKGFRRGEWNREYWNGLFAHGFGLCGTTHSQWTAEMDRLLGHGRGRVVGVTGHNSFEVWLTGGHYGKGRWALLDHDLSTVIFDDQGERLLAIHEVKKELNKFSNPFYRPQRQHGWRVSGLHDKDASAYDSLRVVEYHSGYAGPSPTVHLRRGESLRRYVQPGLEDGETYVFWGRNYKAGGIPGPSRDRTWVNQPDKMYQSQTGAGWVASRVRYGNAVYTYQPNFKNATYKEGVIDSGPQHVTFEFLTPYVIGSTPANDSPWGVYDAGGTNGLRVSGKMNCMVSISTDRGGTWHEAGRTVDRPLNNALDLTDLVKGHNQYWIRLETSAQKLNDSGLTMRTVCQTSSSVVPRLHDGDNRLTFQASGTAITSAGPNLDQARQSVIDGKIDSSSVTLQLETPRHEEAVALYAMSWNRSGSPPQPARYNIEYSNHEGKAWQAVVKDWQITRRPPETGDWWSQSITSADIELTPTRSPIQIRFSNDGGRKYRRVEAHLRYRVADPSPTQVTFAWRNGDTKRVQTATHRYDADSTSADSSWSIPAGESVQTLWVEFNTD